MKLKVHQIKSFLGTGWSFPPTFNDHTGMGAVLVSKEEDIRQSLEILMNTHPGERVMLPDYGCGVRQFIFDSLTATKMHRLREIIRTAIIKYEPRILVDDILFDDSEYLDGIVKIKIGYTVKSNNTRFNLVFPYYKVEGTDIPGIYLKQATQSDDN